MAISLHPPSIPSGLSAAGFPMIMRERTRVLLQVDDRLDSAAFAARMEAFAADGLSLAVRRRGEHYVVVPVRPSGRPGAPVLRFDRSFTSILDEEHEHGARWALVRWAWHNKSDLIVTATIQRVEFRHGHPRTYERGCHCEECTEANTIEHRRYMESARPPSPPRELKHGAACWKRGCYCDEYRKASRERQQRHRALRRLQEAKAKRGRRSSPRR